MRRREWLALLAGTVVGGCTAGPDGGTLTDSSPPTDSSRTGDGPTPTPTTPAGTLDVVVTAGGEALREFERLSVTLSSLVLREDGVPAGCKEGTPSRRGSAASPSPTPEPAADLDRLVFPLGATVDLAALPDGGVYLGRFTVPSVTYTDAYLVAGAVRGRLDSGEAASFREETDHYRPTANSRLRFDLSRGGAAVISVNLSVDASDDEYTVFPRGGRVATDGDPPAGTPRFERGAYFEAPFDEDGATVRLTRGGDPAGGVALRAGGRRYETGADGTVDVPPAEPSCFDVVAFAGEGGENSG